MPHQQQQKSGRKVQKIMLLIAFGHTERRRRGAGELFFLPETGQRESDISPSGPPPAFKTVPFQSTPPKKVSGRLEDLSARFGIRKAADNLTDTRYTWDASSTEGKEKE